MQVRARAGAGQRRRRDGADGDPCRIDEPASVIAVRAGTRICIGMHFSMMEGHLLLATLAQRVSFSLVPGQTIVPDPIHHLTLRPAGKVNVLVKRR